MEKKKYLPAKEKVSLAYKEYSKMQNRTRFTEYRTVGRQRKYVRLAFYLEFVGSKKYEKAKYCSREEE